MSNQSAAKEEPQKPEIKSENENLSTATKPAHDALAFPSEHVPTFLITDGPLFMNVNQRLVPMGQSGGSFQFRYPDRYKFRRLAVEAKLFGVTELIYQNVNRENLVQIWLSSDFTAPPQVTYDNRSGELILTVDQDLDITGPHDDNELGERHHHRHPGSGGTNRIQRVLISDNQNRALFQHFVAREYDIIFYKEHE